MTLLNDSEKVAFLIDVLDRHIDNLPSEESSVVVYNCQRTIPKAEIEKDPDKYKEYFGEDYDK